LPADPVYYAGRIATQVLGGGADSRLFLMLRERKGWTYGAYANLQRYRGLGYWQATAEVRTDVADSALSELLHQIERIRTQAIAPVRLVDGDGNPLTPAELSPKAAPVALDPAQLASHTDSSRVLFQGNPVGASVSALRRTADSLVYTEQSNLGGGAFQQTVTLVLDPADGSSRRLDRVTIQQGQRSEAHLTYSGGRVKGRSAMPQQDGTTKPFDIDTVLPPGTIDEDAVPFSVPAFPLESGKSFTVSFFSPSDGAVKLLTFKVGAEQSVVVPAGTFQAYHIAVTGSRVPFVMYVSTTAPRRLVRTEYVGQPLVVELVK